MFIYFNYTVESRHNSYFTLQYIFRKTFRKTFRKHSYFSKEITIFLILYILSRFMSVNKHVDKLTVYTDIQKAKNNSEPEHLLESGHPLYTQNSEPTNPLRRFVFTNGDYNMSAEKEKGAEFFFQALLSYMEKN